MASGLQCPGCGHVHPSGLPEIARGDATFRCYGCYRTLSIPEGWSGRSTSRPAADPGPPAAGPPGAGTRDARSARLAGRRGFWPSPGAADPAGSPASGGVDAATQLVPMVLGDPAGTADPDGSAAGWAGTADRGRSGAGPEDRQAGGAGAGRSAGGGVGRAGSKPAAPLGWVAPRRSAPPVRAALRALIWTVAFAAGFVVTAVVLRVVGLLGVNTVIDLYAGSGLHRFRVLLVMLPLWALLSATLAHFTLEFLAARRRPAARPTPTAETPTPV